MAICCRPKLLLADEPTTAWMLPFRAQILISSKELEMKLEPRSSLITHNMGVIAEAVKKVIVMYAGKVMECGAHI